MATLAKWLLTILFLGASYSWSFKLHRYFFETGDSDAFAILVAMILGVGLSLRVEWTPKQSRLLITSIFIVFSIALYPIISLVVRVSDLGWIILYLYLFTAGLIVLALDIKRILLILTGPLVAIIFPFEFKKEQLKFYDRVIDSIETRKGSAQIVSWKNDFWLYYNEQLQFSTIDRHVYQEAYIQPVMQLVGKPSVLLIGGDNGMVLDELEKFDLDELEVIHLDKDFASFVGQTSLFEKRRDRENSLSQENLFVRLNQLSMGKFDLVIVDVPDPINVDYNQFYGEGFYELCFKVLDQDGLILTQSGDYFKNSDKVKEIKSAIRDTGFNVIQYHTQIPTIGQWSWIIGSKSRSREELEKELNRSETKVDTKWWSPEAMSMMLSYGKQQNWKKRLN